MRRVMKGSISRISKAKTEIREEITLAGVSKHI